jgi:hypothetical protein
MHRLTRRVFATALIVLASSGTAFAWGAFAVDDEEGDTADEVGYGWSTGYPTRNAAAQAAMNECKGQGNDNCRLVLTFQGCGAYATSPARYGVGTASNSRAAERNAMQACNNSQCQIVLSQCE